MCFDIIKQKGSIPTTALPVSGSWVYSQQVQTNKHPLVIILITVAKLLYLHGIAKERQNNRFFRGITVLFTFVVVFVKGKYCIVCLIPDLLHIVLTFKIQNGK